jgi:Carboxypeptidase regulatory-like domain
MKIGCPSVSSGLLWSFFPSPIALLDMKSLAIGLIGLFALTVSAWSATPGLEGTVKDTNGRPIKGAEVKIEARTGKFSSAMMTDANGHYRFDGLTIGIDYKVTLMINGTIKAQIFNATAHTGKPAELSFDLRKATTTSKRHMVWVPQEIGSHIGGGRWVTVDENGNVVPDDSSVARMGQSDVKQMQMSGPPARAKSGGGQ